MSEKEFLELLNLYLDREIKPEDADRLEREVRANPVRHRTYLQYCRMQQAVRLLGTVEGIRAEDRPAPRKARVAWEFSWGWTGALAAAAGLVLFFAVGRPEGSNAKGDSIAARTAPRDVATEVKQPALGLSGDALLLSTFPAASTAPKINEDQFDWMRQFQLVSLETRAGAPVLHPSSVALPNAAPAAPSRASGEDAKEMAAFKFVK